MFAKDGSQHKHVLAEQTYKTDYSDINSVDTGVGLEWLWKEGKHFKLDENPPEAAALESPSTPAFVLVEY